MRLLGGGVLFRIAAAGGVVKVIGAAGGRGERRTARPGPPAFVSYISGSSSLSMSGTLTLVTTPFVAS